MEELGSRLDSHGSMVRKKRSQTARRPRPEPQVFGENHDVSPLSSVPHSDDTSKASSDEHAGDGNFRGKMFSLNQCMSREEDTYSRKKIKRDDNGTGVPKSNGNSGDHDSPPGGQMRALDSLGKDSKLKKVKLKVGGVTRTIQAKANSNPASSIGTSTKVPKSSDGPRAKQKSVLKDIVDNNPLPDKKMNGSQRFPSKDLSRGKSLDSKEDTGRMATKNGFDNQNEVRKSKRVPKRRVLEDTYDDGNDDELRFLEKMKIPKVVRFDDESIKKQRNNSRNNDGGNYETLDQVTRVSKGGKRSRSDQGSDDTDYEEVVVSDSEAAGKKKKKKLSKEKDNSGSPPETKREIAMTTRQRALYSMSDANQIEFPNGLPPAPSRKKVEQLTETEQQVKKAEAAQRRKMLTEKANYAHHEETVKKVLGQDSSRKKREDKARKRQEELAQARAANAQLHAASTIRWVIGPTGTYIHFPEEMGLPKLFDSKPISYPPPREKCAGPACNNPFKYRDSKTKLPLCSLQCYKAVRTEMPAEAQC